MSSVQTFIFILLLLLYLKWVLIFLIFPFQIVSHVLGTFRFPNIWMKLMMQPYRIWESLFHGGWERYMLFQVGLIPSCHIRKWIYTALGAKIGKRVVFHYRTEIRRIDNLQVGGVVLLGITRY